MKNCIYLTLSIIIGLSLVGCSLKEAPEKELEDSTISKEVVVEEPNPDDTLTEEQKEMIAGMSEIDEPLSDTSEDVNFPGAEFMNLNVLQNCNNMWQFRSDLNSYLIYLFPDIDKQYKTYVIEGSEKEGSADYQFKVRVEGINEDGSDLTIKCQWKYGAGVEHYNFFSDLTPEGIETRVDKDGNPISWDDPLKPYDEW